jgi:hypothetical protein
VADFFASAPERFAERTCKVAGRWQLREEQA